MVKGMILKNVKPFFDGRGCRGATNLWDMGIFVWVGWPLGCFLFFARGRNVVFAVFYLSAVGETLLLLFSIFRPWPKRCFCCFLSFGRGRNVAFAVFYLSAVAETLFSLFFIFRPWPKCVFYRFLSFGRGRNAKIECF